MIAPHPALRATLSPLRGARVLEWGAFFAARDEGPYGVIHPANFVVPSSILIIATGLIGSRLGPMVITPDTP